MKRRRLLAFAGAGIASVAARAQPGAVLPHPQSLAAELARALAARKTLVVMVSLEGCPYCKIVRESYLAPLRAEGQPIVQVEIARALPVLDFQGRATTHEQLAKQWQARVAPTVLFFGREGRMAAPALAGMAIPDFYGAYLQERIDAANRSVAS